MFIYVTYINMEAFICESVTYNPMNYHQSLKPSLRTYLSENPSSHKSLSANKYFSVWRKTKTTAFNIEEWTLDEKYPLLDIRAPSSFIEESHMQVNENINWKKHTPERLTCRLSCSKLFYFIVDVGGRRLRWTLPLSADGSGCCKERG